MWSAARVVDLPAVRRIAVGAVAAIAAIAVTIAAAGGAEIAQHIRIVGHYLPVAIVQRPRIRERAHMLNCFIETSLIPIPAPPTRVEILQLAHRALDVPLIAIAAKDASPAAAS